MNMISSAIRSQAEQQAEGIIAKANEYRDTQLELYTEQLLSDMYDTVQHATGELRQKMLSQISSAERDAYQALLRRRDALTSQVFDDVAKQLAAYADTPAYRERLLEGIGGLSDRYDHESTTVLLRPADMALAARIEAMLPGCAVREDPSVRLGGFMLLNTAAGVRVDETLETRLAGQRPWFLAHCGMRVQ